MNAAPTPPPRRARTARALAALALAAVCAVSAVGAACGGDEPAGSPPRREPGRYDAEGRLVVGRRTGTALPNVVLIVMDTTRRDASDPRGVPEPAIMPEVARFLSENTWFPDASSQASWTAPSVTTLLTGLWPWNHGVGGFFKTPPLVESVATLAEYLRAIGYQNAAFTGGGWVSASMGHGQGYELGAFFENWGFDDPRKELERWIEKKRDPRKPLFLLLHTYEAHDPYGKKFPPEGSDDPAKVAEVAAFVKGLQERVGPDPDADIPLDLGLEFLIRMRTDPLLHHSLMAKFGRARLLRAITSYDREVYTEAPDRKRVEDESRGVYRKGLATLDGGFARLLARLETMGLGDAVTIVCTDHGEAFGEHRNMGHGRWLYDELQRVVLGVRAPGRLPGATRVAGSCGLVDVLPTVLDLCGLPPPAGVDGKSLLPLARGTRPPVPMRSEEFQRARAEGMGSQDLRVHAVRTERAKWIGTFDRAQDATTEEVYDLVADPAERTPLPASAVEGFGPEFRATVEDARARLRGLGKPAR